MINSIYSVGCVVIFCNVFIIGGKGLSSGCIICGLIFLICC